MTQDISTGVNQGAVHLSAESQNQTPFAPGNMVDDSDAVAVPHGKETSVYWGSGNIPYVSSAPDDANSSYPYLPPVLEEPGSSFSEGIKLSII